MMALIEAHDLVRVLPGEVPVTLVDGISLTIERGEFVCIMGPSGSGKSSLLYLLGLLDPPTAGTLMLDGVETSQMPETALADIRLAKLGFVFQFHFLLAEFTVLENVILPMRKLGVRSEADMQARGLALLDQLGLKDQAAKRPHQLSGGQRQRVAIARALANDPLVILADEPTGNLDTVSSALVRDTLRAIAHEGARAVVAVTHDLGFAAHADRTVVLVDGKLAPPDYPGYGDLPNRAGAAQSGRPPGSVAG
jgi:lipoprotein-releasing system ATP-binding protein